MSHKDFVEHLCRALVTIGLTVEQASFFDAQSMRLGGAISATIYGMPQGDMQHLARPELATVLQPELPR